jgi:TrmH family RNA methyltransferase
MAYHIVRDPNNSGLRYFQSLKGKGGHLAEGIFIAETPKIARKILESDLEIVSAFMTEPYFEQFGSAIEIRTHNTQIHLASKSTMESIVGYPLHQGVMLAVRIPESKTIESSAKDWKAPHLIVALDRIADAENMGTIIRNCAAFGVSALIVDEQSCHPYLRRSVRVSMGTIVDCEIIRVPELGLALRELSSVFKSRVVAATLSDRSSSIYETTLTGNITLVFGAEGHGIHPTILASCEQEVMIPIAPSVDSLNVGVACGIMIYEAKREIA